MNTPGNLERDGAALFLDGSLQREYVLNNYRYYFTRETEADEWTLYQTKQEKVPDNLNQWLKDKRARDLKAEQQQTKKENTQ